MTEAPIDLAKWRKPVTYTVMITHHWDDSLDVHVADVASDERSRASVCDALRRAVVCFDDSVEKGLDAVPCPACNGSGVQLIPKA